MTFSDFHMGHQKKIKSNFQIQFSASKNYLNLGQFSYWKTSVQAFFFVKIPNFYELCYLLIRLF